MATLAATGPSIAVKDMIAVKGLPQTAGLPWRARNVAEADAPVVATFRGAGFGVAGVTVTDAAGFGTMTPQVANPKHPARAVGGSSGGSAAAVAAGRATLGLGTDSGGSIRIPAAYCDLFAYKPTAGRVPMDGILPFSPTFDTVGLLAATFDDLVAGAKILGVTADTPPLPLTHDGAALAVCAPSVCAAFAGFGINAPAPPSPDYDTFAPAHSAIAICEAHTVHGASFAKSPADAPPVIASAFAALPNSKTLAAARATVHAAGAALRARNAGRVIASPTLPIPPADRYATTACLAGEAVPITNANIRLTLAANVAGLPALVLPLSGTSLMLTAPHGADASLFATARAFLTGA